MGILTLTETKVNNASIATRDIHLISAALRIGMLQAGAFCNPPENRKSDR